MPSKELISMGQLRRVPAYALLLFLVLLAFSLYVFRLDYQSLWYDEGFSVYLARMNLGEITARTANDIHPPLYYYLLHFWIRLAGDAEFSLRFLSAIFGVLTVPLIWAAGKRLLGETTGVLTAGLVALSPLFLWYSQEARMYTLVTFLCLLSTYLLLRVMHGSGHPRALWAGYVVTNVLAVYTHFYAFFVVAFQLFFYLSWWIASGRGRLSQRWPRLVAGLVCQAAVVVAYLPWAGFVLRRYGADVSYWQGTLRIGEVVRKTLISFSTGQSVLERFAQPIAVGYLFVLLGGIGLLVAGALRDRGAGATAPRSGTPFLKRWPWVTLLGLVLYLGLPCLLLVIVSYQRAKFHPRYLVLSSPAFFLLIGGGLAALLKVAHRAKGYRRSLALVVGCLVVVYLGLTSGYALYNAYFDIDFLKDDFRSAASFIEEHKGQNEEVILTSGHMFPVFTYYYKGDDWHPIPEEPTLSAEHVLGYEVADELNRILAGKDGVWVLLWQDEVVDPVGFLTMMLGEQGRLVPYRGGFWGLRLLHYRLPDDLHFSNQPLPEHPITANFEDRIELLGYTVSEGESTTRGLEVVLYWQALQDTAEDYKVSLRLRDGYGHEWGGYDGKPTGLLYPTFRWHAGERLFGKVTIAPTVGTPPGVYQIQAGLYSDVDLVGLDVLDAQGTPLGTTATLGSIELSPSRPASVSEVRPAKPLEVELIDGLDIVGYDLSADAAQPGDTLQLKLYWHVLSPLLEDYVLLLRTYDQDGTLADGVLDGPGVEGVRSIVDAAQGGQAYLPAGDYYLTSQWREDEVVLGQYRYRVPVNAAAGPGELRAALLQCRHGLGVGSLPPSEPGPLGKEVLVAFKAPSGGQGEALICRGSEVGAEVVLSPVQIETTERVFSAPEVQHKVEDGNLDDKVALYGYDLSAEVLRPGDMLKLTLYWKALDTMDTPYAVFTHLLDETNRVQGQMDSQPLGGSRPTTGWVPQEFLRDEYQLTLASDAPPGEYAIEVGMYDASTPDFRRLPLVGPDGHVLDTRVVLDVVLRVERE
jgi:mannosyltransferase